MRDHACQSVAALLLVDRVHTAANTQAGRIERDIDGHGALRHDSVEAAEVGRSDPSDRSQGVGLVFASVSVSTSIPRGAGQPASSHADAAALLTLFECSPAGLEGASFDRSAQPVCHRRLGAGIIQFGDSTSLNSI